MDKFNLNYQLTIEGIDGTTITITPPISLEVDVQRKDLTSTNIASFRLFNLGEAKRNNIRRDQLSGKKLKKITLRSGYGQNMPIIYNGFYSQAWSAREGIDFVTNIECLASSQPTSLANIAFPKNTPRADILTSVISALAPDGIKVGAIGSFPGSITRGNSVVGDAYKTLDELSGGCCFVDNGVLHCLSDSECISSDETIEISSASGLLGTPIRENVLVHLEMIFEPRLFVGMKVYLDSTTFDYSSPGSTSLPNFTGTCKVISVSHKGLISPSVGGSVITSVGLQSGTFKSVPQVNNG